MKVTEDIARRDGAWVCRFCGRAWRDQGEPNDANVQYLNEHAMEHKPLTRRLAADTPSHPPDPDS